jgi:hypothetical protein
MSQAALDHAAYVSPKVVPTAGLTAPHDRRFVATPDARNSPTDGRPHLHHAPIVMLDVATEALAMPFVGLLVDTALQLVDGDTRFVDKLVRAGAVGLLTAVEQNPELATHAVAFEGEVRATMLCAMVDALLGRDAVDADLRHRADALVDLHVACPVTLGGLWEAPVPSKNAGEPILDAALDAVHVDEVASDQDGAVISREEVAKRLRARVLDPAVDAAIDALPDQERTALVHTYRHGYDVQELATALRVSVVRAVQLRTRGFEHVRQRVS